jgi:putative ABC transport system permease protein
VTPSTLFALAWRESRFARRRLLLFLSAISLGVASLVAVQGFAASLREGVRAEARSVLGADFQVGSRTPFGGNSKAFLDSLRDAGAGVALRTSFASMAVAPASGATRLAQVRAIEPGYPFYGTVETAPAGRWASLHTGRHAFVDPGLLSTLGLAVGDTLALGEGRFRILGTLQRVPGDAEIASVFAPRVFIPARYLDETELMGFGSRVEFDAFVRLQNPAQADALLAAYGPRLRAERAGFDTAAERQEELEEGFGQLSRFLGLIGVFALLLGGIGVASAMGAYIAQKVDTVAVLRCLGATGPQVLGIYLAQAAAMGLAGASLGVVAGLAVQWVLPRLMAGLLPVKVVVGVDGAAILTGLIVGVWTALAFALLPLLAVRAVSPLGALRRTTEAIRAPGRDVLRMAAWAVLALSVFALLVYQVGDLAVGAGMMGGVVVALAVLGGAAWALVRSLRRVREAGLPYVLRQGLANLYRPGNQTRIVVLALGFGVFLLATLLLTQHNLLLPLRTDSAAVRPNLLFFDVQDDQEPALRALLDAQGVPVMYRAPIVPMRIASIRGEAVRPWTPAEMEAAEAAAQDGGPAPQGWAVRREYRSTFRERTLSSDRLLSGTPWNGAGTAAAQVSLEREIADELSVTVGDSVVWDVQGVRVPTVVTSIREVDWARFEPNFFAVFPPAALEGAPKTWVMLTRGETPEARAAIQRDAIGKFSNVVAVDLTQVQAALDDVVARVSAVIRFLAAFSIATGFIVLLGAISASRLQRVRESVLFKTIGATRAQIGRILLVEYAALGLLAVLVGTLLSTGAGWALAEWVFETPYEVPLVPLLLLGAIVTTLAVAVGLAASREVFRRTPMEAIREA